MHLLLEWESFPRSFPASERQRRNRLLLAACHEQPMDIERVSPGLGMTQHEGVGFRDGPEYQG